MAGYAQFRYGMFKNISDYLNLENIWKDDWSLNQGHILHLEEILVPLKDIGRIEHATDITHNSRNLLVISDKMKQILEGFRIGQIQFIPVRCKENKALVGHVVNAVSSMEQAIDNENCVGKPPHTIYALYIDKLNGMDFFRIYNDFFVSSRLMRCLSDSGIKGAGYHIITRTRALDKKAWPAVCDNHLTFGEELNRMLYARFAQWLDRMLAKSKIPGSANAINFNIYTGAENGEYHVELVASDAYDGIRDDWPCYELYTTRDNLLILQLPKDAEQAWFEKTFPALLSLVETYLKKGKYRNHLRAFQVVAMGHVSGDLVLLHHKR